MININVGLLGHVDSGKTTLAKALSTTASTACFDKNPQSQERGITLDLGFSSFATLPSPEFEEIQYTLVDCPGHASLIKTVLGGAQIIDMVILVVDVNKGVQTQTAECLVIAEILQKKMLVVLNKIDLIPAQKRESFVDKMKRKMQLTLAQTTFKDAPIIPVAALCESNMTSSCGVERVIETLRDFTVVPERLKSDKMIMSVDHCFMVKGKGTVMTGTILEGSIRINDNVEIPELKITKKVKTMQMFKREVSEAHSGDRLGVCVTQFDPKLMERGYVCSPGYIPTIHAAIINFSKVKHFKLKIASNMKFHITVGHITVIAKITLFGSQSRADFNPEESFSYIEEYQEDLRVGNIYALLEFEKCLQVPQSSLVIGSNLSTQYDSNICRIAFFGPLVFNLVDANYKDNFLHQLKIYKLKEKRGLVQRVSADREVIVNLLFKKETKMQPFVGLKVELTTGERGVIESSFGQTGKVKVAIPEGLKDSTKDLLKKPDKKHFSGDDTPTSGRTKVEVVLRFKRYIYDRDKKIIQS